MSTRTDFSRAVRLAVGVIAGALALGVGVPASEASPDQVAQAQARLDAARQTRTTTEARLASLQRQRNELATTMRGSSAELAALTAQLADTRREAQQQTQDAYISGSDGSATVGILGAQHVDDVAARVSLLGDQRAEALDATEKLRAMELQNSPQVVRMAKRLADLDLLITNAESDLLQASALEADAEAALARARSQAAESARAAAKQRAQAAAATPTTASSLSDSPVGSSTGDPWAALRRCESGGNYRAVSASGRYRGAYQFDQRTWESVGGTGLPDEASPAEQDSRARTLFEQRGARAWPHCGRVFS